MVLKKTNAVSEKPETNEFLGYTGTTVYAGYFDEDYITHLNGKQALETYEKMRRGDGQIKMILTAIKNPIKSSTFKHDPISDDPKDRAIAEFLDWNWFDSPVLNFSEFLSEALTFLDFGFCIHEKKYMPYEHKELGLVHILADLGYRKQSTIESWDIKGHQGLRGVRQIAFGDTVDDQASSDVYMPRENLLIFTNEKEGDNYGGISLLRSPYGHWFRKNLYLKLNGIGIEKAAIGTPIGTYPRGIKETEKAEFIKMLGSFTGHQTSHIVIPAGYTIDMIKIPFDSEKTMASVFYEDTQIAKTILFQFLELGQNGSSGSYALGADQSDLALASMQYIGDEICKKIDKVNRDIVKWNFGNVDQIPKAKCTGINQKGGKELAELISTYVNSNVIRPDDTLEISIRETHNLPKAETTRAEDAEKRRSEADTIARQQQDKSGDDDPDPDPAQELPKFAEPKSGFFRALTEYEKPLMLSEIKADFEDEASKLHRTMKTELSSINTNTLRIVETLLKKNEKDKTAVAADFRVNKKQYEKKLLAQLGALVAVGSDQARREFEAKTPAQFAEPDQFKVQTRILPKQVQRALLLEMNLQATTHATNIEKIVGFGIISGVEGGKTDKEIIFQMEKDLEAYAESPQIKSAASTLASKGINRGRYGFMFDQENLVKIQAFQYSAVLDGATTPICLSLDQKIVRPNDPELLSLRPPNHYGCRSILVPITIYETKPEITGIKIDPTNESLRQEYERRGKETPSMEKILKSRNL